MTRSLSLSAALLSIVTLVFSHSSSAKTGGTFVQTNVQSAALLNAAAFPSKALNIWANSNYAIVDDGYMRKDKDKDKDWDVDGYKHKDKDKDRDGNGYKHKDKDKDRDGNGDGDKDGQPQFHNVPTPEPSTLLSFGAAILIGGGVLYSRRLRKNK
jgi:PEP-CTERM motif